MNKNYIYNFGIDEIKIGQSSIEDTAAFVSNEIEVGILNKEEYIQITSQYSCINDSIEFYIIDGTEAKPILPIGEEKVIDEKIFYGLRTRFSIDEKEDIVIKKNGIITDTTLEQAINSNEGGYTVTYTPINAHSVIPSNNHIKIKAILRLYDKTTAPPHIKSITIKKYGRASVWKNMIG